MPIKAAEFDRLFDEGGDISEHVDWSKATRPNLEPRRVNVDFPAWMVERLDARAAHLGITRQALIKMWIAERLDEHVLDRARRLQYSSATAEGDNETNRSAGPRHAKHPLDRHIGARLRHRRWIVGMTQQQLGDIVNVQLKTIQKFETGVARVPSSQLWDVAQALGVSMKFFFEGFEGFEGLESEVEERAFEGSDSAGKSLLEDKEALELVQSYFAIPEAQRRRLIELASTLKETG
jgi:transcriptional regulator with XRE-family HTH domain